MKFLIHITSLVTLDNDNNSASQLDTAIRLCFLDDQAIVHSSNLIIQPDVDFRSSLSPAQSLSQYALIRNSLDDLFLTALNSNFNLLYNFTMIININHFIYCLYI